MRYRTIFWTLMLASIGGTSLSAQCPATATPGQFISFQLSATVPAGPAAPDGGFWQVSPSSMSANPSQGSHNTTISGAIPAGTSGAFTIQAFYNYTSGSSEGPYSFSCTIQIVTQQPLQINGYCPSNSFQPGAIISIPFSASGGNTKQYVWGVTSPFSVSPGNGPNTFVQALAPQGSTTFVLTLGEGAVNSSSQPSPSVSVSCQINIVITPITITGTCPTSTFAMGDPVTIPLAASGGSGNYAWQLDPSNTGLSLTNATGTSTVVTGTATLGAQVGFTVTLADLVTKEPSALFICRIKVRAPPLSISGVCPAQPIVTGVPFSLPLTGSGGVAPLTWQVSAGPLAPSSTTGSNITIGGTPTAPGPIVVNVTLSDSIGTLPTAGFSCTLSVVAPLTITASCPVAQIQGKTVTVPLSGSGGSGNYLWTSTGPSFLSLTSGSGASTSLTGVASDAGMFPFTVSLADDLKTPLTAPFACSLQVVATLTLLPANFADGTVGQTYPGATVSVSGGVPPYIIRVSKGPLPPGLVIDSATGAISGTPTQAGTFPFTVTVTDTGTNVDNRQIATADYQIRIVDPPKNTTACPLPTGTELQPYNAPLTATGGTGQYVFSLSGTSLLPPGLVLDQNAITGTPQGPFPSTPLTFQLVSGTLPPVTFTCAIAVLGRKPTVTVNGLFTNTGSPLVTSTVSLSVPVQEDVKGTAVLTFTPNLKNTAIKDNPQVQFCGGNPNDPLCGSAAKDSSGLLRLLPFTVRAGLASTDLAPLVTSNCAGTVQIALNNLTVGSQSLTAAPLQFTITPAPPAILATPQVSRSGQNLQITVKVASNTGELTSATAVFTAAPGSQLDGASSTTSLSSLFQNFTPAAVDATHPIGGCAFTLTLPYSIAGDPSAISTVTLTLTNSVPPSTSTPALPVP